MKEYLKPDVELIVLATEDIANTGTVSDPEDMPVIPGM